MAKCSFADCDLNLFARGWCHRHWRRWKNHGSPNWCPPAQGARFWSKVDWQRPGGCWVWTGPLVPQGYGMFSLGSRSDGAMKAHRYSYTHFVGPVPDGLHLDHICNVRACVNPWHLRPVTVRENVLRGVGLSAANARKSHCPRGHPLSGENLYEWRGQRRCKACIADHSREWWAVRRSA